MGNRGTTPSWDDEEIAKWGFWGHQDNIRRGIRMRERIAKDKELMKLLVLLRKHCTQSKLSMELHREALRVAQELCTALRHTTFLGGPCERCITASQTALEVMCKEKA